MGGGRSNLGRALTRGSRVPRYIDFGAGSTALHNSTRFFNNPNNSNSEDWMNNLTYRERQALENYTDEGGIDYHVINKALYTKRWDDIAPEVKARIKSMDSAFDKSLLLRGIQVTRQCDFQIFGAKYGQKMSVEQIKDYIKTHGENNVLGNRGYLSFGANNHGAAIAGSGLVIHASVPPSRGAGAYVNPISTHSGSAENEYLFNRGSNFKFDLSSIRTDSSGKIHINATWVPGKKKRRKK